MKCQKCEGKGTELITGFIDYRDRSKSGFVQDHPIPCGRCGGSGEVSEAQAKQRRIGRYYRKRRIEMDLSMREAAQLLGISIIELNDIEHGRSAE